MIVQEENYLKHQGVKGMKWGVRNNKSTSNGDVHIKKGTSIHRISSNKEKGQHLSKHVFATFQKTDIDRYRGFFAKFHMIQGLPLYDIKFNAKKDLVSPSKKKRVDEFIKTMSADPKIAREIALFKKQYSKKPVNVNLLEKKYLSMGKDELKQKVYDDFQSSLKTSDYNRVSYFNQLKKQGYSFIVDDNDVGVFGNKPILVFDRDDSLKRISATELTKKDIDSAITRVTAYADRMQKRKN